MFKFLLLIILIPLLIAIIFGVSVLRFLFMPRRKQNPSNNRQSNPNSNRQQQTQRQSTPTSKKIIDSNEGEYIDYEEVKD